MTDSSDLERRSQLAREGERLLPSLSRQQDTAHGMTLYGGFVPASGSTAYLICSKLGEGAASLRLVIRSVGASWLNVSSCTVKVDGREVGSFVPAKGKLEKLEDGKVIEFLDVGYDEAAPVILSMLDGNSATISLQGANGTSEIALGAAELGEMRKVLAAYEYLQTAPRSAP